MRKLKGLNPNITREEMCLLVEKSKNFLELTQLLGISNGGDTIKSLKKLLIENNINYKSIDFRKGKWKVLRRGVREQLIKKWKKGELKGYTGKTVKIKPFIRDYLFKKFQSKCGKCGWNEINPITFKVPLEVNHLDGNAKNCVEENLELLCPNCHSLTPNFRSLNKKSVRER